MKVDWAILEHAARAYLDTRDERYSWDSLTPEQRQAALRNCEIILLAAIKHSGTITLSPPIGLAPGGTFGLIRMEP